MNELARELTRKARARIADETAWTQDTEAVNRSGEITDASSETACAWCATGALNREAYDAGGDADAWEAYEEAVIALSDAGCGRVGRGDFGSEGAYEEWQLGDGVDFCELTVRVVNDQHGHGAVMDMFDRALAAG